MVPLYKRLQWVNVKQKPFMHNKAYPGIFKTLCNPGIFRTGGISITLTYSEPEVYSQPWYIQNPSILKLLAYWKSKTYSEPCQTSMRRFTKLFLQYWCFLYFMKQIWVFFKYSSNFYSRVCCYMWETMACKGAGDCEFFICL